VNDEIEVFHPDEKLLELVPGFGVLASACFESYERGLGTVEMVVAYSAGFGRLVAESVKVSVDHGQEVTGTTLRAVRVQQMIRNVSNQMTYLRLPSGEWESDPYPFNNLDLIKGLKTRIELEDMALRQHVIGNLLNLPPLKLVSEVLNVSQSTATRMVAAARKRAEVSGWDEDRPDLPGWGPVEDAGA